MTITVKFASIKITNGNDHCDDDVDSHLFAIEIILTRAI